MTVQEQVLALKGQQHNNRSYETGNSVVTGFKTKTQLRKPAFVPVVLQEDRPSRVRLPSKSTRNGQSHIDPTEVKTINKTADQKRNNRSAAEHVERIPSLNSGL
jgi:hypothetical protein